MINRNILAIRLAIALIALILLTAPGSSQPLFSPSAVELPLRKLNSAKVADFNEDGQPDIVALRDDGYATDVSVLLMQVNGWYTTVEITDEPDGYSIWTGDFNADNHADILINEHDSLIYIIFGNGNGTFDPPETTYVQQWGVDTTPIVGAVADIDLRNGDDLIFGDDDNCIVLQNDGAGNFSPLQEFDQINIFEGFAAMGDLNGDSYPDFVLPLIVGDPNPDNVRVYLNDGTGQFTPGQSSVVGKMPADIDVADMDNDDILDIVVALIAPDDDYPATLTWLKGYGDGTFDIANVIPFAETTATIHPFDANNDGNIDLAVTDNMFARKLGVMPGDGAGNFQPPAWLPLPGFVFLNNFDDMAAADFNGDGYEDLFVPHQSDELGGLDIFYGGGDSVLQFAPRYGVHSHPYSAAVGDFNNDQADDIAVACGTSQVITVLLNDGAGSLDADSINVPLPGQPKDLRTGDLNNDDNLDLIVTDSTNGSVITLLGDGTGAFGGSQTFLINSLIRDLRIADFDENGDIDVVLIDSNRVTTLLGDGAGSFSDSAIYAITGYPLYLKEIQLGDFNEDDHLDIVVTDWVETFYLLLGAGDGSFGDQVDYANLSYPEKIAVSDVNSDGHQDVIVSGSSSRVYLGLGDGQLDQFSTFPGAAGLNLGLAVGDVNNDLLPDIAINDFILSVYIGDGLGNFQPDNSDDPLDGRYNYFSHGIGDLYNYMYNTRCLYPADFNSDGSLDLALIHNDTNLVSVLFGQRGYTHDVGVLSISAPPDTVFTGVPVQPAAVIINTGAEEESFQAYFHIGLAYKDTVEVTLGPGDQDAITFDSWTPQQAGDLTITCGIILPGDENPANDIKTDAVIVIDLSSDFPLITAIRRNYGGDQGWLTTLISGYNFQTGATARLIKSGSPDILAGDYQIEHTEVLDSTQIRAVFNLTGVSRGDWSLIVANPDGNADTLVNGFTVEQGNQHLWLDVGGLSDVLIRRQTDVPLSYNIYAGNSGNFNLDRVILTINIPEYLQVTSLINPVTGDTLLYGDSLTAYGITAPSLPMYISTIHPGEVKVYEANVFTDWETYPWGPGKQAVPAEGDGIDVQGGLMDAVTCFGKSLFNSMMSGGNPQEAFEEAGADALNTLGESLLTDAIKWTVGVLIPGALPFIALYELATDVMGAMESFEQLAQVGGFFFAILFGWFLDPNDKAGPAGYGEEGFICDDRLLQYTIYFENVDTATIAVPNVTVIDTMDIDLDWSTFQLVDSKHLLTDFAFDTTGEYGIATFQFIGIDLPPDTLPPAGQSWFTYTIWPDSDLSSGTEIANQAAIIFWDSLGANDPILTHTVLNTIDNQPPQSAINSLPSTVDHVAFNVSWLGSDSESGIYRYNVYVSRDNADYNLWLTTPDTSAVYVGKNGSSYRFFSEAIDNVGFTEARPAQPDAITTIDAEEDIGVNPNPFVPARGHEVITFFGGGLANSSIKIYNKAGRLVRTLHETAGESMMEWDAANDDGEKLASGVYIWILDGPAGKDKGKFAIIR